MAHHPTDVDPTAIAERDVIPGSPCIMAQVVEPPVDELCATVYIDLGADLEVETMHCAPCRVCHHQLVIQNL